MADATCKARAMALRSVRYRPSTEELHGDGICLELDASGDGFVASTDNADISLTSLRDALARYADNYRRSEARLTLSEIAPTQLDDEARIEPVSIIWRGGELRVVADAYGGEE